MKDIHGNHTVRGSEPGSCQSASHGKLTAAPDADMENCRTIYGLWCSEKGATEEQAVCTIRDNLRFSGFQRKLRFSDTPLFEHLEAWMGQRMVNNPVTDFKTKALTKGAFIPDRVSQAGEASKEVAKALF